MSISLRPRAALLPLALAAAFPTFSQTATLNETVVTATRFAEPAQSLPMGVTVITADEIRASGATNVTEALMRLIGVPGRQDLYGGGEYTLDLRGFGATASSNQVVILDGQRLSEADMGGARMAGIPIESIDRIEVLRGSGAVLYGEGASGGVVVITTKAGAGKDRRNAASIYAGAGTDRLRDARASATLASGAVSLDADAQRRTTNGHRANSNSELEAGSLRGQWSNDWLRFGAGLSQDELDSRLPGALSRSQYDMDPSQTNYPQDRARLRNTRGQVFAQAELGSWQIAADAGQRQKVLRSFTTYMTDYGPYSSDYDYDVDANSQSLRARHEGSFASIKNVLVIGADRNVWKREVLGLFGSMATQHSRAVYLKDDVTLPTGTRISAGGRTERIRKDYADAFSSPAQKDREHAWELGASQELGARVTAYARAGRSYRLANVDEFSFTSPGASLLPQTSRDTEAGARWSHASGSADARVFRSSLNNEIGYDPNAANLFAPGANVNFDPTRRQGVEVDVAQKLSSSLGLRLNASVRKAEFRSGAYEGQSVPLVPRRTLALRADWAPAAGHRVTGGVAWVSSQYADFNNSCTVPSYTTADARYAYQWQQAELSLGVSNLFDRKYYTQAFGCAAGAPTSIYPEAGRAVTAALRVWF